MDVGERRIGIAVSEGRIAFPLRIIEHRNRADDIARVCEAARERDARALVVGLPLLPSGDESEQTRRARRFGEELARASGLPVYYEDELISTRDASGGETSQRRRRTPVDDRAASIILQRYIDGRTQ